MIFSEPAGLGDHEPLATSPRHTENVRKDGFALRTLNLDSGLCISGCDMDCFEQAQGGQVLNSAQLPLRL